jgi:hypothetical protein
VAHGLLAVDALADLERLGGDLVVPVVGGGDDDENDVLVVEDLAVVPGALGLASGPGDEVESTVEPLGVDLGNSGDPDVVGAALRPLDQGGQEPAPSGPNSDDVDVQSLVGPLGGGHVARRESRGGGAIGRGLEESATGQVGEFGHRRGWLP